MKIKHIKKIKTRKEFEQRIKDFSSHSYHEGKWEEKSIFLTICDGKKERKKMDNKTMEWLEKWSLNFKQDIDKKFSHLEKNQEIMQKEIININNKISTIEKNQKIMNNKISTIENKISNIEKRVSNIENKISTIENKISNIEKRVSVIENKISNIEKRVSIIEKDIELIKRCPTIEKEIQTL